MRIDRMRLFRPTKDLRIQPAGFEGKHVCLNVFPENTHFLKFYKLLKILPQYVRFVVVPTTTRPRTRLTAPYKKALMDHGLRAIKTDFGGYESIPAKNFYIDLSTFMLAAARMWKFTRYNVGRPFKFIQSLVKTMEGIPGDQYHKILLYVVDLNGSIPTKIFFRKIFPIYKMIISDEPLPFDKLILCYFSENDRRFILLWDKDSKNNPARIRSFLLKLKSSNPDLWEEEEKGRITDEVERRLPDGINKKAVGDAVRSYIEADPVVAEKDLDEIDPEEIAAAAVAYHTTGDVDKARTIARLSNAEQRKEIIRKKSPNLLPRRKLSSTSTNSIIKMSNIPALIDNQVPTHIIDKRKRDFSENLEKDIVSILKPLEAKPIPLKVKKIEKKLMKSSASELLKTIKDRYLIELVDDKGNTHTTHIDLPHLTENGTFMINGRQRILINQLITYPIFFFKPFYGRFSSVYAQITIQSKQIKKGSYLMGYMGGYKTPLIEQMSYMFGFEEVLKLFDIKYKISEEPIQAEGPVDIMNIRFSDKRYINFSFGLDNEVARQYVNGLNYIKILPKITDISSKDYWRQILTLNIGTRNCIYIIDQILANVVTPIEKEVLSARGDPTELDKIIKYISVGVVEGRVDDRNSLDKQRVRTSEVFIEIISSQINSGYNEFLEKRRAGDENAKFELHPTKAYSEVITSQNVQLLESINPIEELSMMTRVIPIGIGGIPDKRAISEKAMNIHYTYFGNIDPLETPNSEAVGILQHLTVGASITNDRGLFAIKNPNLVKGSEILSIGPAMIPFAESTEGARITMASGQIKQAVPLKNPEVPAVQTGYESILTGLLGDNFISRSTTDGIVESIGQNLIKIRSGDGRIHNIDISSKILRSGQGKNGISIFVPKVEIGQKVKSGMILAEGGGVKNGTISIGVNMLVALMPWKGYNFEDAIVISKTAARKLISIHLSEEHVYLAEDEDVINILEIGSKLDKGEVLMTYSSSYADIESRRHLRAPDGGKIINIEVYTNIEKIPEKLETHYERWKEIYKSSNGRYPQGHFQEKGEIFEGILIKFILSEELNLVLGDKLNNRHFSKGVVSIIESDDNMPVTPWGEKVDMILNPLSIVNRMNVGLIFELYTGLISWKLAKFAKDLPRSEFVIMYGRIMTLLDGTKDKSYSKTLIQKINALSENMYRKMILQIVDAHFVPIIIPPFKTPDREDIIKALNLAGMSPGTKLKLPEFNKTTGPIAVGYLYQQKLEHMSERKLASRSVGAYAGKTMAPVAGRRRGGGQRASEQDLYSMLSWDVPYILEEFFGPLSSDHVTKNEIISEIIQKGKAKFVQTKHHPEKEFLSQMMLAIHLTSK